MKVVIAPDSFKESLSAADVAHHIEAGFREILLDWTYVKVPLADGGEGTVEVMIAATNGHIVEHLATGPLAQPVNASFGLTGDGRTAVIEIAVISGLTLLPVNRRDPMSTSTFGLGELIGAALVARLHGAPMLPWGVFCATGLASAYGLHRLTRLPITSGRPPPPKGD